MGEEHQLGVRALKLLGERWMVAVLRGLAEGAQRPAELERRLPDAGHSNLLRRLRRLLEDGLVTHAHLPGVPPQTDSVGIPREAHYVLTDAGWALLEVARQVERWERTWCSPEDLGDRDRAPAIRLTADTDARRITLLLADGPLSGGDLEKRIPDLARSALRRRVRRLWRAGLLEQRPRGRERVSELTAAARNLALVSMRAGVWECQWSKPPSPTPGRDLSGLLRLLAPVASTPEPIAGLCQLHLEVSEPDEADIYVAALAGHVALADAPAGPPQAVANASPAALCAALLAPATPVVASGDRALLAAILEALSAALLV
jgi:DNA-binding HxlR family transcriptional regulator